MYNFKILTIFNNKSSNIRQLNSFSHNNVLSFRNSRYAFLSHYNLHAEEQKKHVKGLVNSELWEVGHLPESLNCPPLVQLSSFPPSLAFVLLLFFSFFFFKKKSLKIPSILIFNKKIWI